MDNINDFLESIYINKENIEKIIPKADSISLSPGEKLNDFGEHIPGLFYIQKGTIRSLFINESNEIITLKKYTVGEKCGTIQFYNLPKSFCLAASTKVKGILIRNDQIINILEKNPNSKKLFSGTTIEELFYLLYHSSSRLNNLYYIKNLAEQNLSRFQNTQLLENNIRYIDVENENWILMSNNIKKFSAGSIFNKKTSIKKTGDFYIKLIKIEGKWPLENIVKTKKNLLIKNQEKDNESFENWYGNKNDDKFPHTKGNGFEFESLACIRMICIYFEIPFNKDFIKKVLDDQIKRTKQKYLLLNQYAAILDLLGIKTTRVELNSIFNLTKLQLPLLLIIDNHPLIIWKKISNKILISNPKVNQELVDINEFILKNKDKEITGLIFEKTIFSLRSRFSLRWFIPSILKYKNSLVVVVITSFFIQLFALFNPLLIQQIIDAVISQGNLSSLNILGLLLIIMALSQAILTALRTFLFANTTNKIDLSLGGLVINHLYRLPLKFFLNRSVGEVNSRVSELENIREFLTGTALTAVLDAIFSVIYIFIMLLYSVTLTFCSLAVIPFFILLTLTFSPILRTQYREQAKAKAAVSSHLVESINGIETIKGQGAEVYGEWRWENLYNKQIKYGFRNTITSSSASSISGFLQQISSLVVIWVGALLVLRGELTLGGLIAFRILSGYVTSPLMRLTSLWQNFQETIISLERISDVINNPKESELNEKNLPEISILKGNIKYENVNFAFNKNGPLQIKNINLNIEEGSFVGIIGKSGSGKSTFLKLLSRFYLPLEGTIKLDDIDISKINLYCLRDQIGIVAQESFLFDGTIQENISLNRPDSTLGEVKNAAKIACADLFISELPQSYNTKVGERGSLLSGGQRQRISLARMVLSEPKIIILDEATSSLDIDTERKVIRNLLKHFKGKTILFISHRLNAIKNADKIIVMNKGFIDEEGSHQELINLGGRYKTLLKEKEL